MSGRPAAFLDRDGTLMTDSGFIGDPNRIEILTGVPEALRLLEAAGFARIVVTNQSGVARGYFTESDVSRVHEALGERLARDGASIDAYYFCTHVAGGPGEASCDCRKPGTGMIRRAVAEHDLDLGRSVVFGDRSTDIALGANAGLPAILVNWIGETGAAWASAAGPETAAEASGRYAGPEPLARFLSLLEAVRFYLAREAGETRA